VVDELAVGAEPGLVATPSGRFFDFVIGGTLPAALAAGWPHINLPDPLSPGPGKQGMLSRRTPKRPSQRPDGRAQSPPPQLIEAAKRERNGVRWVVALVLGLRQGEALGLKWYDIAPGRGTIRFPAMSTAASQTVGTSTPATASAAGGSDAFGWVGSRLNRGSAAHCGCR
jgi:hypothetical protein